MPGWGWRFGLLAALLLSTGAARGADLFSCRVIVSGTEMRLHPDALERCAREAVVALTGRPSLRDSDQVGAVAAQAGAMVEDLVYLDRMSDVPHHDEQGTRERPYDLVVHFDPEQMEAALRAEGLAVWRQRPVLLLDVAVEQKGGRYRLVGDEDAGERQREAALAAGERYGLRVAFPRAADAPATRRGWMTLSGVVAWSDADFGWNGFWRLGDARWEVRGMSFDEVYRVGVGGVAERLAPK